LKNKQKMQNVLKHKWKKIGITIDFQCSKCGTLKHWDDRVHGYLFIDRGGTHYNRPPCILLNATAVTFSTVNEQLKK